MLKAQNHVYFNIFLLFTLPDDVHMCHHGRYVMKYDITGIWNIAVKMKRIFKKWADFGLYLDAT